MSFGELFVAGIFLRIHAWVFRANEREYGGQQGKAAVSESNLRQRKGVRKFTRDEAGECRAAIANEIDHAEDWGAIRKSAAVKQSTGGGAKSYALASAGENGRNDEQHQRPSVDCNDDADHSPKEDNHAYTLSCRWAESAPMGAPRTLGAM